jgi:hypothetical protein
MRESQAEPPAATCFAGRARQRIKPLTLARKKNDFPIAARSSGKCDRRVKNESEELSDDTPEGVTGGKAASRLMEDTKLVGRISRRRNPPSASNKSGGLRCANPPYSFGNPYASPGRKARIFRASFRLAESSDRASWFATATWSSSLL